LSPVNVGVGRRAEHYRFDQVVVEVHVESRLLELVEHCSCGTALDESGLEIRRELASERTAPPHRLTVAKCQLSPGIPVACEWMNTTVSGRTAVNCKIRPGASVNVKLTVTIPIENSRPIRGTNLRTIITVIQPVVAAFNLSSVAIERSSSAVLGPSE